MDKNTYLNLIQPAIDMVVKKHQDYNTGISLEDYFPFQDASYVQMLHVKTLRLRSLARTGKPNYESALDSVYDLINYAVFYAKFLREQGPKLDLPPVDLTDFIESEEEL